MFIRIPCFLVLVALVASDPAIGQDKSEPAGFRGEFLGQFNYEADRVMQLANAIPEEKYSWRPAEGVRSISEVYMHIAGTNIIFPALISGEKVDFKAVMAKEKSVTSKADVAKELAMSVENVRKMVNGMSDADLEKSVTISFIPMTTTARGVIMLIMSHISEHLGQSIAYSRTIGVVPPWTAAEKAKEGSGEGY